MRVQSPTNSRDSTIWFWPFWVRLRREPEFFTAFYTTEERTRSKIRTNEGSLERSTVHEDRFCHGIVRKRTNESEDPLGRGKKRTSRNSSLIRRWYAFCIIIDTVLRTWSNFVQVDRWFTILPDDCVNMKQKKKKEKKRKMGKNHTYERVHRGQVGTVYARIHASYR